MAKKKKENRQSLLLDDQQDIKNNDEIIIEQSVEKQKDVEILVDDAQQRAERIYLQEKEKYKLNCKPKSCPVYNHVSNECNIEKVIGIHKNYKYPCGRIQ